MTSYFIISGWALRLKAQASIGITDVSNGRVCSCILRVFTALHHLGLERLLRLNTLSFFGGPGRTVEILLGVYRNGGVFDLRLGVRGQALCLVWCNVHYRYCVNFIKSLYDYDFKV